MESTHRFNGFFRQSALIGVVALAGIGLGCGKAAPPEGPGEIPAPGSLTVYGLSPSFGFAETPNPISILGTGFQQGATVTIAGVMAPATFVSTASISSVVPAHASGFVDVVVTNPDGTSYTRAAAYEYFVPVKAFSIAGNTLFTAVGQTSQLTATASYADGTTKDVTRSVQWLSFPSGVIVVAADGVATATAIGPTTVQATYKPTGVSSPFVRSQAGLVKPPGSFVLSGWVREPGVGYPSGVRVFHPASGQVFVSLENRPFALVVPTSTSLLITKDGYEDIALEATPDGEDDVPLQRVVRVPVGSAVTQRLEWDDVDYLVNPSTHCQPCRLIRVTSTTPGTLHVLVNRTQANFVLNVWVNGQGFAGSSGVLETTANVPIGAGELVLYVGMNGDGNGMSEGDRVPFTLSTTFVVP